MFATVNGTIKAGERTFEIENGQGVREHILVGQAADPIRNLPAPRVMWWLYATKDDIGINFFRPGIVDIGTVYVGNREIKFNPAAQKGSISYQTLAHWEDPRNGYHLPVRWHLNMTSTECVVDLDIALPRTRVRILELRRRRAHVLLPAVRVQRLRAAAGRAQGRVQGPPAVELVQPDDPGQERADRRAAVLTSVSAMALLLKSLRSLVVTLSTVTLLAAAWFAIPFATERRAAEPPWPAMPAIERDAAEAALRTYGY